MNFNKNRLKDVDGVTYVSQIAACLPSQMGFSTKIDLFIDNYKETLIRGIRHDLEVLETTEDLTKLLENTLAEVYNTTSEKEINIANDYDEYLSWLYGDTENIGFKSGLINLDNILGKFQAGRMIGIFARSGVGKSTVAIQIALNMALQKHKVIYGSGEMSKAEVLNKMAASRLSIPYELLASKEITLEDKDRVCDLISNLMNNGLYITNETDLNKLLAEVKSYKLKYGLDVLFVDYVNKYIKANNRNLSEKIGEVTRLFLIFP
jgi:replicative DNA helicase